MMKFPIFSLTRAIFLSPDDPNNDYLGVNPKTGEVFFLDEYRQESTCLSAVYTTHRMYELVCASEYDIETDGNKYLLLQKHWPGKRVHTNYPLADDYLKNHSGCGVVLKYFERPEAGLTREFLGIPRGAVYKDLSDPREPGCILIRSEQVPKTDLYYIVSPSYVQITGETHESV